MERVVLVECVVGFGTERRIWRGILGKGQKSNCTRDSGADWGSVNKLQSLILGRYPKNVMVSDPLQDDNLGAAETAREIPDIVGVEKDVI